MTIVQWELFYRCRRKACANEWEDLHYRPVTADCPKCGSPDQWPITSSSMII